MACGRYVARQPAAMYTRFAARRSALLRATNRVYIAAGCL
jgi:hypothetical protein